jgi:hypothetical protein
MELAENGSLHSYLRKHCPGEIKAVSFTTNQDGNNPDITIYQNVQIPEEVQFVKWCYEISKGMEYLAYKKVIIFQIMFQLKTKFDLIDCTCGSRGKKLPPGFKFDCKNNGFWFESSVVWKNNLH